MSPTPPKKKVSAAQQAADRQRRLAIIVFAVIVVIGIVAVVAIAAGSGSKGSSDGVAVPGGAQKAAIISDVLSVPASALDKVGEGTATAGSIKAVTGQPALTKAGKPEMLYIGAEYCPYCATERWAMAVALSRFGTLDNVGLSYSSGTDVYPNTSTLTFHGSTFTSKYFTFTPVEETTNQPQGNGYKPLDPVTPAQQKLITALDSGGSIPFISFGNKFMLSGATYSPTVVNGKTWAQIASDLKDPSTEVAKGALGAANQITAAICKMTNGQPGNVCTSAGVKAVKLSS